MKRIQAMTACAVVWIVLCGPAPAPAHGSWESVKDPALDARREIRALLDDMADAVLDADRERYLACIDPSDPVFATEQRAWSADLVRTTPTSFIVEMPEEAPVLTDDGWEARSTLTVRWTMPGGQERRVVFPARFVQRNGRWLYAGRAWQRLEADGVLVLHGDGLEKVARKVVDAMPEIMARVHTGFEITPDPSRVQQIKLYRSMRELQFSIYPSYTQSLSGWNEPGESIKLLTGPVVSGRQLKALLTHEYGHVASFLLGEKMNEAPWWVLEGVAELASEHLGRSSRGTDRLIRRLAHTGRLADWNAISDFHTVDPALTPMVYVQGHHMLGYISERFGRNGRNCWLRAMARGLSLDEATREALGMSFADLDRQWRDSLDEDDDG